MDQIQSKQNPGGISTLERPAEEETLRTRAVETTGLVSQERETIESAEIGAIGQRGTPLVGRPRRGNSSEEAGESEPLLAARARRFVSPGLGPAAGPLDGHGLVIPETSALGTFAVRPPFSWAAPEILMEEKTPDTTHWARVQQAFKDTGKMSLGVAVSNDLPGSESWELGDLNKVEAGIIHTVSLPGGPLKEPTLVQVEVDFEAVKPPGGSDSPGLRLSNGGATGDVYVELHGHAIEPITARAEATFFRAWNATDVPSYFSDRIERKQFTIAQSLYLLPGATRFRVAIWAVLKAMKLGYVANAYARVDYTEVDGHFFDGNNERTCLRVPEIRLTFRRYAYLPR